MGRLCGQHRDSADSDSTAAQVVSNDGWLGDALATGYGTSNVTLDALTSVAGKRLYRVDRGAAASWLLRVAAPATAPDAWRADATVLDHLQQHAYPAPRVVRTVAGEPVLAHERGLLFATTFIPGIPVATTPETLTELGRMAGRLHALPLETTPTGVLPHARMLPATELAYARSQLDAVREEVPPALAARYEILASACEHTDWGALLPSVLLHNDCHPGNAIQAVDGNVVLIDWEGAGLGPAIIDLGFLLVSVALRLPPGWDHDLPPDDWRPRPSDLRQLAAVLDGYARERTPSPEELDGLAGAMRFRSLVAAACSFARQVRRGLARDPAPWWWWRYTAAESLAAAARRHLHGSG